jgi:hypothetical protein
MVKGSCGFGHWTLVVGEGPEREGEMPTRQRRKGGRWKKSSAFYQFLVFYLEQGLPVRKPG